MRKPINLVAIVAAIVLAVSSSSNQQADAQELSTPRLIAHVDVPGATMIDVQKDMAAVAAGNEIHIINLDRSIATPQIWKTISFGGEVQSFVYRRNTDFRDSDTLHAVIHDEQERSFQSLQVHNDLSSRRIFYYSGAWFMWPLGSRYLTFRWVSNDGGPQKSGQVFYDTTAWPPKHVGEIKREVWSEVIGTVEEQMFMRTPSGVVDVYDVIDPSSPRYRGFLKKSDGSYLGTVDLIVDAGHGILWGRVPASGTIYVIDAATLRVVGKFSGNYYGGPGQRLGRHVLMGDTRFDFDVWDVGVDGGLATKPLLVTTTRSTHHQYIDGRLLSGNRMVLVDEKGIDVFEWQYAQVPVQPPPGKGGGEVVEKLKVFLPLVARNWDRRCGTGGPDDPCAPTPPAGPSEDPTPGHGPVVPTPRSCGYPPC